MRQSISRASQVSFVLLAALALLASCQSSPPAASRGAASASPSPIGSAQPISTSPSETPPEGIQADSVAIVLVDDLRVREKPSLTAKVVGTLSHGDQVFVTSKQVEADNLTWRYVQGEWLESGGVVPLGYVAEASATGPFFATAKATCPSSPIGVAALTAEKPWEPPICFGAQSLTFTAWDSPENYGFGGICDCVAQPGWLIHPFAIHVVSPSNTQPQPWLVVRSAPGVDEKWPPVPADGHWLKVTGHFDDPASSTCEFSNPDPAIEPGVAPTFEDKTSVVLRCREQFVVTAVSVAPGP